MASTINEELVSLYWRIGHRIRTDILDGERAGYGKAVIKQAATVLSAEFGRGFGRANLHRMVQFAETYPDEQIVAALRRELSWTHFRELLAISNPLKRQFYAEMARIERWSTRTLKAKVAGMLFERTAIAKEPEAVIKHELEQLGAASQLTPDFVFRDPYVLDFLDLPALHSEQDLEAAILQHIEAFILELGTGFTFVARQRRMSIGPDDYYLDLLFFHRKLRCLVAIELKLGRFDARDKGQMELYLRWLDTHDREPGEGPPLGLILCSDKNEKQIELLELNEGSLRVASYLTDLPPVAVLEKKLADSIALARSARAVDHTT